MDSQHLLDLGLEGFTGEFARADDNYIADVETLACFHLPKDYKEFLRNYGASFFAQEYVAFCPLELSPWAVNGLEIIVGFYGKCEDDEKDIKQVYISLRDDIPNGTIAIGDDAGRKLFLLNDRGEIYCFDQDTAKIYLCARDFASFVATFRNVSEEEILGPSED
jgi:hypothetical protein